MTEARKAVLNKIILNKVSQLQPVNMIELEDALFNSNYDISDVSEEILSMDGNLLLFDENDNICLTGIGRTAINLP